MIANKTGSHVDFGARAPEGHILVAMFMSHALSNGALGEHHVEAARGILGRCAGLPIALAVTGEAVAARVDAGLRFERACSICF